ncbi:MAG: aldose epimerase family protein [Maribacter sp.]|uniref:aldose epimerase family protein n=1 Tax=Maribacter sp. TaxID=1897614 RepID=UPI003C74418B
MKQVTISNPFITLIVLDYGAIIQKLLVKDDEGRYTNVVVGFDYPSQYHNDKASLGACIGRYAGRISKGGFTLDRKTYPLFNEKGVHLHGGKEGFSKKYWTIEEVHKGDEPFVRLSYFSKHLEEGYPGNLKVTVTYKISNNELHIIHEATTDFTTVVNLTNHSYFKLDNENGIDHYFLKLNCPKIVETHENLLPTGKLTPVKDTPYDFSSERQIGATRLDTPFATDDHSSFAAMVYSTKSGISMEVNTNQRGVVIYTPQHFPAICFETQNFPDAPNHPNFPSSVLRPSETYRNASIFKFDLVT